MPTNATTCEECEYYRELKSPMPGESWNRCSHKKRRIESSYISNLNVYGYANRVCEYYKVSWLQRILRRFRD